jgi:UDP-N-acetylmuramoyl-tripeptide--D-alanyl-D-alanine ligase
MIALSLTRIADIVGGAIIIGTDPGPQALTVDGPVEFDSRRCAPGGLFVALAGERVDGHDYLPAAAALGAVAALVTRVPADTGGLVCVLVADTEQALGALAAAVVRELPQLTVIAITGSSGKTSTKDLVAALLEPLGPTVAPPGSFNNELGHPHTVLRADRSTRFLVLEASARGVGHIRYLMQIAPPRIGVVLNVGSAHLGEFGDRATIAKAKGELVEALPPAADGGVAVLNVDDPAVAQMASRTDARIVGVGESRHAGLRAADAGMNSLGQASFLLQTSLGDAPVTLQVAGEHQIGNALAAAAVAIECGATLAQIAAGLNSAKARSHWRMEVTERPDGVTVINDAYNANPESVRAALKALAGMGRARAQTSGEQAPEPGHGRTWAVLGPMAELGPTSLAEHDAIGRLAVRLDISRLIAVGDDARAIAVAGGLEGSWNGEAQWSPDLDDAFAVLQAELAPGDIVLIKASRSAGLERLAARVLEDGTGDGSTVAADGRQERG